MSEVLYVTFYMAGLLAISVTGAMLILPGAMLISARVRHDFAVSSYAALDAVISSERFEGHPTEKDNEVLATQRRIIATTQTEIDSGDADRAILSKDIVMAGYITGDINALSVGDRFLMTFRRIHYGTISVNRLEGRLEGSTGIARTRIFRVIWVGFEFAYLVRVSLKWYFKPVWNQLYVRGAAHAGAGAVAGLLVGSLYWSGGNADGQFWDATGIFITIGTFVAYDVFCVRECVKVTRAVRAGVPADASAPRVKLRRRDKVMVATLPVAMVFTILSLRYQYNIKLIGWVGHEFSRIHVHGHVPNYIIGAAMFCGVGLGCFIAVYVVAKRQIFVTKDLVQNRLRGAGTISLLMMFGFLSAWFGTHEAIYGVQSNYRLPHWVGWLVMALFLGGPALLGAGRLATMLQNRRTFKREVGRPHRWQPKIWIGIAATWLGVIVGMLIVFVIAADNEVAHDQTGAGTLPGYVMPACLVVVGIGWIATIGLLVLRKKRKEDEQVVLGLVRRQQAAQSELPENDENAEAA